MEKDGVLYANAAEVPRHRRVNAAKKRPHVKLTVTQVGVTAEDLWV
jgi:hypothetical protein